MWEMLTNCPVTRYRVVQHHWSKKMNSGAPLLPFQAAGLWGGALEVGPHTLPCVGGIFTFTFTLPPPDWDSEATGNHRLLLTLTLPGGRRYDKELQDSMG